MTTHACPPKNAITESEYRQLVEAAGGPGMIFIDGLNVTSDPPSGLAGAIAEIINWIFPEPRFPCCEPKTAGRPVPHTLTAKAQALPTRAEPEAGT